MANKAPCGAFIGVSPFGFDWRRSHISGCEVCQDLIAQEEARFAAEYDDERQPMPEHDSWGVPYSSFRRGK